MCFFMALLVPNTDAVNLWHTDVQQHCDQEDTRIQQCKAAQITFEASSKVHDHKQASSLLQTQLQAAKDRCVCIAYT